MRPAIRGTATAEGGCAIRQGGFYEQCANAWIQLPAGVLPCPSGQACPAGGGANSGCFRGKPERITLSMQIISRNNERVVRPVRPMRVRSCLQQPARGLGIATRLAWISCRDGKSLLRGGGRRRGIREAHPELHPHKFPRGKANTGHGQIELGAGPVLLFMGRGTVRSGAGGGDQDGHRQQRDH